MGGARGKGKAMDVNKTSPPPQVPAPREPFPADNLSIPVLVSGGDSIGNGTGYIASVRGRLILKIPFYLSPEAVVNTYFMDMRPAGTVKIVERLGAAGESIVYRVEPCETEEQEQQAAA